MKHFTVGSRAFFSGISSFHTTGRDTLRLVSSKRQTQWREEHTHRQHHTFSYIASSPAEMIQQTISSGDARLVGKFLVPQVAAALNLTVDDILPLEAMLDSLGPRYEYEAVIFRAIINNRSFDLTEAQRMEAYQVYQSARRPAQDAATTDAKTDSTEAQRMEAYQVYQSARRPAQDAATTDAKTDSTEANMDSVEEEEK
ncbi:MAG: hypothetical protein IJ844_03185 [Prevotella sp.]|nr:hypothetical protein [Prevotella sp.]